MMRLRARKEPWDFELRTFFRFEESSGGNLAWAWVTGKVGGWRAGKPVRADLNSRLKRSVGIN